MNKKTCGECIFYHGIRDDAGICALTDKFEQTCDFVYCCKSFHPAPPITKGDKIKQMSNEEFCIFMCRNLRAAICKPHVIDDNYEQKLLAWLNAPAESEVGR